MYCSKHSAMGFWYIDDVRRQNNELETRHQEQARLAKSLELVQESRLICLPIVMQAAQGGKMDIEYGYRR